MENVCKRFARAGNAPLRVLDGVSAEVEAGTFAAIRGPSGCGKSTMLLIAGALLTPDSGAVTVAGENLIAMPPENRARRRAALLGFVFQKFHLLPYLTVEENVRSAALALKAADDKARAGDLIERFGLNERRRHLPRELSVGEQQRVAMARALFNRPKVLLADEPTGNLDPENGRIVLDTFQEFAEQGGTVLMVTHHPDAAARAGKVWQLDHGRLAPSR
jgi:ABC-type lipoprotein export system ATPase subunit